MTLYELVRFLAIGFSVVALVVSIWAYRDINRIYKKIKDSYDDEP